MTEGLAIRAGGIVKSFGAARAVDGASVAVEQGHLVALLGPSGSGKTTLLPIIAGFDAPDAGTVRIGGRLVAGDDAWVEPDKRRVGMVFQDGALFPHLTVADNVAFGKSRKGRVDECLELVGLAGRARSYPHELSGGERQRVALARALATEPAVVLLDEPFASLDAGLRTTLREEVAGILRAAGASALLVTHDQQEALSLADTVVLLRDGRVEQVGEPEAVYSAPATRWAAEFLGAVDVVPGTATDGVVTCELGRFPVDADFGGGTVDVLVRPESVGFGTLTGNGAGNGHGDGIEGAVGGANAATATIVGRAFYGPDQLVRLVLAGGLPLRSRRPGFAACAIGEQVRVWVEGPVKVIARQPA